MDTPVFLPLRSRPEMLETAAAWFASKWRIPLETYRESMLEALAHPGAIPQWYVVLDAQSRIIAGAGAIANDFHNRPDLTPNICAVFVERRWRGRGVARMMLDSIRRDLGTLGIEDIYLITGHTQFYEHCGWSFLTMVREDEGGDARMYTAKTCSVLLPHPIDDSGLPDPTV